MDEAWKEFIVTGRVTDYLRFKGVRQDGEYGVRDGADTFLSRGINGAGEEQEVWPDGTEYCSDRNGLAGNANWRL